MNDLFVVTRRPTESEWRRWPPFAKRLVLGVEGGGEGAGGEGVALGREWFRSLNLRDVVDWEGVARLTEDIGGALRLRPWQDPFPVDLWEACRIDFALYEVSKWVANANIAREIFHTFPEDVILVDDGGTPLGRAIKAVGREKGREVTSLGHRGEKRKRTSPAWLRVLRVGARSWRRWGDVPRGSVAVVNHVRRNSDTLAPILEGLQNAGVGHSLFAVGEEGVFEAAVPEGRVLRLDLAPILLRSVGLALAVRRVAASIRSAWEANASALSYRGVPLRELAPPDTPRVVAGSIATAGVWCERTRAAIDRLGPRLLVTGNERSSFGRAIASTAVAEGVPVLAVQYGMIWHHPVLWTPRVMANAMAAEGERPAEVLRGLAPPGVVRVTGQAKHDLLRKYIVPGLRLETRRRLGLDDDGQVVLYASHAFGEESVGLASATAADRAALEEEVSIVYDVVSGIPGVSLLVKPHPNEDLAIHMRMQRKLGERRIVVVPSGSSLTDCLAAADVVITHHSTAGLDALVAGIPLVIVNLTGVPDAYPYVSDGGALGAYRPEDLHAVVTEALLEGSSPEWRERRRRFLELHAADADGGATNRIVDIAQELLKGGAPV